MEEIDKIKKLLTSTDLDIIKQSLDFVNNKIVSEKSRSERAETRANTMLTACGIIITLVVAMLEKFLNETSASNLVINITFFVVCFLILRAMYYLVKVNKPIVGYELMSEFVFDFQPLKIENSLKEELAYKIWESKRLIPVSNERLYYLHRGQRNLGAAIVYFIIFGLLKAFTKIEASSLEGVLIITIGIGAGLLLDTITERVQKMWTFSEE